MRIENLNFRDAIIYSDNEDDYFLENAECEDLTKLVSKIRYRNEDDYFLENEECEDLSKLVNKIRYRKAVNNTIYDLEDDEFDDGFYDDGKTY